jgi:hypothetical protein
VKEAFLELQFCEPGDEHTARPARANTVPSEDYSEVFLSHAHLYIFAEKYDIQPLKRLALKLLHQTLAIFTPWPECVGDIVTLIRFIYKNTARPQSGEEPMNDNRILFNSKS